MRDEFRTIERETDQYIVGSVGIPDYTENYDPHVYVQADGWLVAYYLAADPTSMVIDLRHYGEVDDETERNTMLERAIGQILTVTGLAPSEISYYDFRYPDATNLMLITEVIELDGHIDREGEDSFDVKLLTDFTFYERSWSHAFYATDSGWESSSTLYVNDAPISSLGATEEWKLPIHNTLEPSELPPGVFHTVRVSISHGSGASGRALTGMALTYREAPQ